MKYLVSCSFGKDSLVTVILAVAYGLPIDAVVYARIMFDKNISAEPPEHEAFIHNVAIPTLEKWGIKTIIVDSPVTFQDCFFRVRCRGKNKGKFVGFPIPGRCDVLRDCKLPAIEKARALFKDEEVIWYIGIASDETIRLQRLKDNQIPLLAKFGYTEKMAAYLCQWYGLYSPHYRVSKRGGVSSARIKGKNNFDTSSMTLLICGNGCLKCLQHLTNALNGLTVITPLRS